MKLYRDLEGNWVGTLSEAKKEFGHFKTVDVPTIKQDLLIFLNIHKVGSEVEVSSDTPNAPKAEFTEIEKSNLQAAFEQAGATREALRRVFDSYN